MSESAALLRPRLKISPSTGRFIIKENGFVEPTNDGTDGLIAYDEKNDRYICTIRSELATAANMSKIVRAFGLEGKKIEVRKVR